MSTSARLTQHVVGAAAVTGLALMFAPTAGADTMPNGLTVSCNGDSQVHASCVIGGCPRVDGDYVVDAVHVMVNGGGQSEYGFKCINGATARHGFDITAGGSYKVGVQACRKVTVGSDKCTPWSDYVFHAPAPAAMPMPAPKAEPAPPPVVKKPDIKCPAGSPTPTVPDGQTCAPIPDVTNAIQASFGRPSLNSIPFNVTNTSAMEATCNYTATANSLNPLVAKKTTRQFNVPANGKHTESFPGAATLTTYNVTLSCHDAGGKQKSEMGHVETSVLW